MTTTVPEALAGLDVDVDVADALAEEAMTWLHDPKRTAHRLVSLPTAVLVAQAVGSQAAPAEAPALPGGLWRVLPDRLLALRPRRGDTLERLRIRPAEHLALTAAVLEWWGWAHTGGRIRTRGGRRCILGAQAVVYQLGYGTQVTATEAGRLMDGVLERRGIRLPYPEWNESPRVTADMALALVREAAKGA
jgi:hypothetical protein